MTEAGLTPYEALRTTTVNVADYLGESKTKGHISPGYRADLILLDENPLEDIKNVGTVSGVFTQNRWISRTDIQQFLKDSQQQNKLEQQPH